MGNHGNHMSELRLACVRSAPFLLPAIATGIVFGTLLSSAGMSLADGMLMSGFVYSGAAQFVGLELMGSGAGWSTILLTTALLSLRFLLYGLTLAEEVKSFSLPMRFMLGFLLIDQVFVLAKARYDEPDGHAGGKKTFLVSCALIFYVTWVSGTLLGGAAGREYADMAEHFGISFIAFATFAAMLGPHLRKRRNVAAAGISVLVYLCASGLPYGMAIPLACIVAILAVEWLWPGKGNAK